MTIEKRIPMAGNMEKMASDDLVSDTATVEGEDWSLTIPRELYDETGPSVIESLMKVVMVKLREFREASSEGQ